MLTTAIVAVRRHSIAGRAASAGGSGTQGPRGIAAIGSAR